MTLPVPPMSVGSGRRRARSVHVLALQVSAVALSFTLVALLVVTSSKQAFTAQTNNVGNQVSSANLALSDNDNVVAMFNNVANVTPNGGPYDRCITVTYTGSSAFVPTAVKLYMPTAPTTTSTPNLAGYLNLSVDMTTSGSSGDTFSGCSNFNALSGAAVTNLYAGSNTNTLSAFASTYGTSFSTGLTTWTPSGNGDSRTFRFRLAVQDTNSALNLNSTFGFQWETHS